MSVPAFRRKESPLQVYEIARSLRKDISNVLLKRLCNEQLYKENVVTEDNTNVKTEEKYPDYMVNFIRQDILTLLQKLMQYVTMANAIYPTKQVELDNRIILQNYAIGTAESLLAELNYCADIFPKQLNCLMGYADKIDHFIKVARNWKRANNKIEKRIKGVCPVSTNFANVNNDGSANNDNASNSNNGVSPDFVDLNKMTVSH